MTNRSKEKLKVAIILATKNRAEAVQKYAFHSLKRSLFRNFICIVWDASDNTDTWRIVTEEHRPFDVEYCRAPRRGLASQRNDAVEYVLAEYPQVPCILFIDDDSELSSNALQGVLDSFQDEQIWGVNIPHARHTENNTARALSSDGKVRRVTPYLHNRSTCPESHGISVDWLSGCGMAFRVEVFRDLGLRFPEAFQKFGGYALGEDVALSYYLHKKMKKKMINSVSGLLCHHAYGSARLNITNMAASKWHNFHLLFDAIYDDVSWPKLWWLKIQFKLFMCAAAVRLLIRARSFDIVSVIRGINAARAALKEFHATQDIKHLMRALGSRDTEVSKE